MVRNLGTVKQARNVKVTCVDNGKSVDAILIDQFGEKLIVELSGGLRLTMQRHHLQKNIYIATHSGMEFQCKPTA
jgi:hypothetical protein